MPPADERTCQHSLNLGGQSAQWRNVNDAPLIGERSQYAEFGDSGLARARGQRDH